WAVDYSLIRRAKRTHPSIVVAHRVDGSAADYGGNPDADRKQARVNMLADVTIFQSRYSRHSTREKFPVVAQDGPVIYNPVDIERFRPGGPKIDLPAGTKVACASWSTNRRKGNWQIDELAARNPQTIFVLCGRFEGITERPNVVRLGHLDREAIATALRSCDVFLSLTENDSMPNVVLEALASGLPVLYLPSGGVPEIVGECGVAMQPAEFTTALRQVESKHAELSAAARLRAEQHFAPDVILPKYVEAFAGAVRRPEPSPMQVMQLWRSGYPVLPKMRSVRDLAGAIGRRAPAILGRPQKTSAARVGWITYDSYPRKKRRFEELDSFTSMRVGQVATWINATQPFLSNELFDPRERYDVVVFQKMMNAQCQDEAARVRARGGKVLFDANVNYYETWGDYIIAGTRPTDEQQRDAHAMTKAADWVVADSSYLERVIKPINSRVTWIADNVNTEVYRPSGIARAEGPVRLIWSGIGKKAAHLLAAAEAFAALSNAELLLVVDEAPACLPDLEKVIPCRVIKFSHHEYAKQLAASDIIISPKLLVNAYEMGHTEYKITLGMACGLPAVASPQQSYLEAIGERGGGVIADTSDEWRSALLDLAGHAERRRELGERAHATVVAKYSTPVIAGQYLSLLRQLAGLETPATAQS
ncbi:MAG TPA: glycosyltransferase, partial [Vicinamibacterales bacterium]|nr:glycosyltransferase [Vicinamibacterales bacterium]